MAEVEPLLSGTGSPAALGAILNDAGEPVPEPPPREPTDVPLEEVEAHPEPEGPEPDDEEDEEPELVPA